MQKPFTEDQACGMLVGLAVGDALGTSVEGQARSSFTPLSDMAGGGPHDLRPGQWTDDTSMAMCLAQMIRSANGWDAEDAMKRLLNWRNHGYLSSTRACFGMGQQVADAIQRFEQTGNPYAGPTEAETSGSAGVARLAPVVLAYGAQANSAMAVAQLQSRLTHASPLCQRAAANLAQFMATGNRELLPRPDAPPDETTGYVVHTLHAAYWALTQGDTFRDVVLCAVNLGGDAATVGAVTGQLAGRIYGHAGIPGEWTSVLYDHDKIRTAAEDLYAQRPIDV